MCYHTEVGTAIHPNTQKTAMHSFVKYVLNSSCAPGFMPTMVKGRSSSFAALYLQPHDKVLANKCRHQQCE